MKVLITGASGVIGRALTVALASSGYEVRAAVRDRRTQQFPGDVEVVRLTDLSSPIDWPALLAGMDAVVHLAGIAHIGRRFSEAEYDRINHVATAELAEAAAHAGIRLVYASSIRAMAGASADHLLTEQDAPAPTEPYGRSKLAAEQAVRACGVPFTILRPVLVYSTEAKGNLANLLALARAPLPLPFGGLTNRRSLLAVENLIAAFRFALDDDRAANQTFIVADPSPVTVPQIIAICRAALGRSPSLFRVPLAPVKALLTLAGQRAAWSRIVGSLEASPAKLIAAGWRPVCDTRDGLTKMVQAASPPKSGTASCSTL